MKVEVLGDNYSLGSFSEELALHEEAPTFPGVCVSVGDIIEDYEENTLRYVAVRGMPPSFHASKNLCLRPL
jgi:hypothetical protein